MFPFSVTTNKDNPGNGINLIYTETVIIITHVDVPTGAIPEEEGPGVRTVTKAINAHAQRTQCIQINRRII